MSESAEERRDIAALTREFEEIFAVTDKKTKAEAIKAFIKNYLVQYISTKEQILAQASRDLLSPTTSAVDQLTQTIIKLLMAANNMLIGADFNILNPSEQASRLGTAMGYFLGAVEFGLTDPRANSLPPHGVAQIMAGVTKVATTTKALGKKIRVSFIKSRLRRIARKSGLSEKQKLLILEIAKIIAGEVGI